jgi:Uracil DNA glycosylase superfamily
MIDFDPGAPPSIEFDKGPPIALARHFAALPPIPVAQRVNYWYDWGPVFYRGRLNGSAKLLAIASDPGPTERLVSRTFVGDAGQRVQGFLAKLGLTTSYVLVNAFQHAVHPSDMHKALPLLSAADHLSWRNRLYDLVSGPGLEAVIAFGGTAQAALHLWDRAPAVPTFEVPHPSAHDGAALAAAWAAALPACRAAVTPDPDGNQDSPNYGPLITEDDYARIPPGDLPFGVPIWIGDDRWGRTATPRHNNTIARSRDDVDHVMTWQAPDSGSEV